MSVVLSLTPTQDSINPNSKNSSGPEFDSHLRQYKQDIRLFQDILQDFKVIKSKLFLFLSAIENSLTSFLFLSTP